MSAELPSTEQTCTETSRLVPLKIPIIRPGLIFVQKAFLLGSFSGVSLFSEGLIIGRNFAFQNGLGLAKHSLKDYENSLKQLKTTSTNSP